MKTINSVISVIVLMVMLVSPQMNVSAADVLTWENRQDMPTARYNMGAAVSGGKIYVFGGDNYSCTPLTNVEEYDPSTNMWSTRAGMPTGRWGLSAATGPDGRIYTFGGWGGCDSTLLSTVEIYDPATDSWDVGASMPTQRYGFGVAAATNGKIYVFGGENSTGMLASVEEYDPGTNTWLGKADMPHPRKSFTTTAASNGKIYLLGGDPLAEELQEYDPMTDSWTSRAMIPTTRYGVQMSQGSDGRIFAIGGVSVWDEFLNTVESYDPLTDTWRTETSIKTPRSGHAVVTVDQSIFAIGGGWRDPNGNFGPIASVEVGTITSLPPVLYVKQDGLTSGSCDSWDNACDLQYALTSAVSGQEIWTAAGVYKPTTDPTDRTATFQLKSGVGLYGGFTGTETSREERNWEANKTILSGDIDDNDSNEDGNFIAESTVDIQGANSFHIVIGSNINNTVVLDGIIITAGNADGTGNNISDLGGGIYNDASSPSLMNVTFSGNLAGRGAGMYNLSSSPSLTNVTFSGNSVGQTGGGMDNISGSNPSLVNVTFSNNSAGAGGGMDNESSSPSLINVTFNGNSAYATGGGMENTDSSPSLSNVTFSSNSAASGGGMWNWANSSPSLVNVTFNGNSAERGGGIYNRDGNPSFVNVTFSSNSAGIGGGMYNENSSPILKNVNLIGNSAVPLGGGMYNSGGSPSLTNVTFSSNSAASGGGIANEYNGNPIIINSILYNDTGGEIFSYVSSPDVSYSIVQGGYAGTGNIDADPLFVDAANGDLHLQPGSPAIDSGTNDGCPSTDFDGTSRPQDGNGDGIYTCDMGAFEVEGQPGTPPANDNFADAATISGLPFSSTVNNMFATVEAGEPQNCDTASRTVWYSFTPAANMLVLADMMGSDFGDTTFRVYQASESDPFDLTLMQCASYGNSVKFNVDAGITYYIQAGSINSFGGELHLNLEELIPPPNDNFADAETITTLPFGTIVDITGATTEQDEPSYCAYSPQTVWYKLTPTADATLQVNAEGNGFNTVLTFYQQTGPGFGGLSEINCIVDSRSQNFRVQAGVTYYIQAGSTSSATGGLHLSLEEISPPANDNFESPTVIFSPLPFDDTVDMTNASLQAGEPKPSSCAGYGSLWKTVWYVYTPGTSGAISVSVPSAPFAPVLTAYTGSSLTNLTELGCQSFSGNELTLNVEAGITYYFQVGKLTWWDADGSIQFNIREIIRPSNDDFADAITIETLPYSNTQDTTYATSSPDDPTTCTNNGSVWYNFTATSDSLIDADTFGSGYDTVLSVYTGERGALVQVTGGCNDDYNGLQSHVTFAANTGITYYFLIGRCCGNGGSGGGYLQFNVREIIRPANDDLAAATEISTLPFTDIVNNTDATLEPDESQPCPWSYYSYNTVWYKFTPERKMALRADMAGSSFGNTAITLFLDSGTGITPWACRFYGETMPILVEPGTTYYFRAGNTDPGGGELHFSLYEVPVPPNDNFGSATVISSLPFTDRLDNLAATMEPNEPQNCDYSERTVWYAYTPTEDGLLVADMYGSNVWDTVLSIYQDTETGLGGLQHLGCMSYGGSVSVKVKAGNTYYIQAKNVYGGGIIQVNVQQFPVPPNDDFIDAKVIEALPFSDSVDITYATKESNEPSSCHDSPKTVWYSYTPTANILIQVDAEGSDLGDPMFNVYLATGSGINDLSYVACGSFGEQVVFTAQAGKTYYIQAGSYYDSNGTLRLNLKERPRPANDDFANAMIIPEPLPFDHVVDTQYSSREPDEPTPSCVYYGPGTRSVWYAFTPSTSGSVSVSVPSSAFTPVFAVYTGSSLADLTQVGCQTYNWSLLTFHVNAGTTYYFQIGNNIYWDQGGSMQFHLDVTPPPQASFSFSPSDPSIFDTIQFYNNSYDPGQAGYQSFAWDLGDGTTSKDMNLIHNYAKDGDYTVKLSFITRDGRTASTSQVVSVRTHDVAITKLAAPTSASPGQTRTVTVSLNSKNYSETVRVDLYRSIPGGYEYVGSLTQVVPARSSNRTVAYNFSYTFTSGDAAIGKVTFHAVATLVDGRDSYPADNEAYSLPVKVNKRK